jgi:hypothetical protein
MDVQAKRTLPGDVGVSRSRLRSAPYAASFKGCTGEFSHGFRLKAQGSGLMIGG